MWMVVLSILAGVALGTGMCALGVMCALQFIGRPERVLEAQPDEFA